MKDRPVINIPKTAIEKGLNILSVVLLGFMFLQVIFYWSELPEQIPIHFNAIGEVDDWGGKGTLFLLPIIGTIVIYLPLFFLSRYPHVYNYPVKLTQENASKLYLIARRMLVMMNFEIILFFAVTEWEMIRIALGKDGFGIWPLPIFLFVLFGTMGVSLYSMLRMRSA